MQADPHRHHLSTNGVSINGKGHLGKCRPGLGRIARDDDVYTTPVARAHRVDIADAGLRAKREEYKPGQEGKTQRRADEKGTIHSELHLC